jgi:hypothetical protein
MDSIRSKEKEEEGGGGQRRKPSSVSKQWVKSSLFFYSLITQPASGFSQGREPEAELAAFQRIVDSFVPNAQFPFLSSGMVPPFSLRFSLFPTGA